MQVNLLLPSLIRIFATPENGAGKPCHHVPGGFADLSAKLRKFFDILVKPRVKYLLSAAAVLVFAQSFFGSAAPYRAGFSAADTLAPAEMSAGSPLSDESPAEALRTQADSTLRLSEGNDPVPSRRERRAAREEARRRGRFNALPQEVRDSIAGAQFDSLVAFKARSEERRVGKECRL